jgi:hypothetical protein
MCKRPLLLLLLPTCAHLCPLLLLLLPTYVQDMEWRDYVRGKDLHKFLSSNQELLDQHTKPQGPGRCGCIVLWYTSLSMMLESPPVHVVVTSS